MGFWTILLGILGVVVAGYFLFFNPLGQASIGGAGIQFNGSLPVNLTLNQSINQTVSSCTNLFIKSGNSIAIMVGNVLCWLEERFLGIAKSMNIEPFHLAFVAMVALLGYLLIERIFLHGTSDWLVKIMIFLVLLAVLGLL